MARAPDFDEDKLGGSLLDYWPAISGECPPEIDDKGYGRRLRDWAEGRPGHRAGSGVSPARWPPSPVSALSASKGGAAEGDYCSAVLTWCCNGLVGLMDDAGAVPGDVPTT